MNIFHYYKTFNFFFLFYYGIKNQEYFNIYQDSSFEVLSKKLDLFVEKKDFYINIPIVFNANILNNVIRSLSTIIEIDDTEYNIKYSSLISLNGKINMFFSKNVDLYIPFIGFNSEIFKIISFSDFGVVTGFPIFKKKEPDFNSHQSIEKIFNQDLSSFSLYFKINFLNIFNIHIFYSPAFFQEKSSFVICISLILPLKISKIKIKSLKKIITLLLIILILANIIKMMINVFYDKK
jgi:hypothetical protein